MKGGGWKGEASNKTQIEDADTVKQKFNLSEDQWNALPDLPKEYWFWEGKR